MIPPSKKNWRRGRKRRARGREGWAETEEKIAYLIQNRQPFTGITLDASNVNGVYVVRSYRQPIVRIYKGNPVPYYVENIVDSVVLQEQLKVKYILEGREEAIEVANNFAAKERI